MNHRIPTVCHTSSGVPSPISSPRPHLAFLDFSSTPNNPTRLHLDQIQLRTPSFPESLPHSSRYAVTPLTNPIFSPRLLLAGIYARNRPPTTLQDTPGNRSLPPNRPLSPRLLRRRPRNINRIRTLFILRPSHTVPTSRCQPPTPGAAGHIPPIGTNVDFPRNSDRSK